MLLDLNLNFDDYIYKYFFFLKNFDEEVGYLFFIFISL